MSEDCSTSYVVCPCGDKHMNTDVTFLDIEENIFGDIVTFECPVTKAFEKSRLFLKPWFAREEMETIYPIKEDKSTCRAYQASDSMICDCGNRWDMNDPYPPECIEQAKRYIRANETKMILDRIGAKMNARFKEWWDVFELDDGPELYSMRDACAIAFVDGASLIKGNDKLTMRDKFAMAALIGYRANSNKNVIAWNDFDVAIAAYDDADRMLEERDKR